jgi:hypothetical protein
MMRKTSYDFKLILLLVSIISPVGAFAMVPVVNKITIGRVKDILKKKITQINPEDIRGDEYNNKCAKSFYWWTNNQNEKPKQIKRSKENFEEKDPFGALKTEKTANWESVILELDLEEEAQKNFITLWDPVVVKGDSKTLKEYLSLMPLKSVSTLPNFVFRTGLLYVISKNKSYSGLLNFYCPGDTLELCHIIDSQWGFVKTLDHWLAREAPKFLNNLYISYDKEGSHHLGAPQQEEPLEAFCEPEKRPKRRPKRKRNEESALEENKKQKQASASSAESRSLRLSGFLCDAMQTEFDQRHQSNLSVDLEIELEEPKDINKIDENK